MAALCSSSLTLALSNGQGIPSTANVRTLRSLKSGGRWSGTCALFGGGSSDEKKERKFITREEEPDQYWQSASEREGRNPMTTPLPYIAIIGLLIPFGILALGFVNGWIKVPVR